jgi:prepilin-type N-terminal cleavage/methylation domain-containing protein
VEVSLKLRISTKGFTLLEVVISISLMAILAVVSIGIVVNLVRSSAKSQASIDVEQAGSFVMMKIEDDVRKSYSATVSGDANNKHLDLYQGSPAVPVVKRYSFTRDCGGTGIDCVTTTRGVEVIKLTDYAVDAGVPRSSSIRLVYLDSDFSRVTDNSVPPKPLGVNIKLTLEKAIPSGITTQIYNSQSTFETTVVLRGSY